MVKKEQTMANGVQVRTQDHLKGKVNKKLEPLIEDEKLMLRSLVSEMAEKGYTGLAKKIGADAIITDLEKAEMTWENCVRKARSFFNKTSRQSVALRNSLDYEFKQHEKSHKLTASKCREQVRSWSEKIAEREANKTSEGKKLKQLEGLKDACEDAIMEADTQSDLTRQLNAMLGHVGIEWNNFKSLGFKQLKSK